MEASEIILKHFFVFDSEHLEDVKPAFYGYTFLDDRVVTDIDGLKGRMPGKEGVYVYIYREGNRIIFTQDFMGSYGLYLYRREEYFAISNSLMMLIDHLKMRGNESLTLNKEYVDYMLCVDVASSVYGETLIREISFLDRSAVVEIAVEEKTILVKESAYEENLVEPDTPEGIAIIDAWRDKWVRRFRNIAAETTNITADLSGGFDTRVSFCLLLSSGIDINKIKIYSITDKLHSHKEDFRIASIIAEKYGFELNKDDGLDKEVTPNSIEDMLKISFYTKLGCHKELYYKRGVYQQRRYSITGSAGAVVRSFWNYDENEFVQESVRKSKKLAVEGSEDYLELCSSIEKVLRRSFMKIREKYDRLGMSISEENLAKTVYRETRCRNHFGKANLEKYIDNLITFAPLIDPDLYKLKLSSERCDDPNLLVTLIMDRYCPGMLDIEFEGGREIDEGTIKYARKINQSFPFAVSERRESWANSEGKLQHGLGCSLSEITDVDNTVAGKSINQTKKYLYRPKSVDRLILMAFETETFQKYFMEIYSEYLYNSVLRSTYVIKFHPLTNLYIAFGMVLVLASEYGGDILKMMADVFPQELAKKLDKSIKLEDAYKNAMVENQALKDELDLVRGSKSFRIGSMITARGRVIKKFVHRN